MRLTRMFLPTLKESPADAEVISHRLMTRSGMIRKVAAGIYNLLPMGLRVIRNVERIVREEMTRSGAQEVSMPFVLPAELWKESGRWDVYGSELLRVQDRHGRDFCLGPTHEEVVTDMVRREVRSYRQLPLNLFQIQTKFRDEIRPRFGLMRGREFVMKDAYSFHSTDECAEREYRNMYDTYMRIFERCGLLFRAVEAETGQIGGSFSHEFMVLASTGEDAIAGCSSCPYAANTERAEIGEPVAGMGPSPPDVKEKAIEEVRTPGMKSVEEVSAFLKVPPARLIKTLIYSTDKGPVAALVAGDCEINEAKLKRAVGTETLALADEKAVGGATGAPMGFAGPVGLRIPLYADWAVRDISGGVAGANSADAHIINVAPGRDFKARYGDLRAIREGDPCPRCGSPIEIKRGIEVGHIFKLGAKYSAAMNSTFLDENGGARPFIMGCYGIGIGRTAAAAIEQNHDAEGIIWPRPLAPFDCHLVPVNVNDSETVKASEAVYSSLVEKGYDVLYDDRDERAGVKFKDADLIGVPVRITVSSKTLKEGAVEVKERKAEGARLVKTECLAEEVKKILAVKCAPGG
ncbi:MAG: proline--tRNA ligase [Deltaproteobacteria bacterium]|nr:proline--tRNA ligase [Deltaproteobacteria bacterium]